jgi:hypothetical protein
MGTVCCRHVAVWSSASLPPTQFDAMFLLCPFLHLLPLHPKTHNPCALKPFVPVLYTITLQDVYLFDCGSTHGTHINRARLKPRVHAPLRYVLHDYRPAHLSSLSTPPHLPCPCPCSPINAYMVLAPASLCWNPITDRTQHTVPAFDPRPTNMHHSPHSLHLNPVNLTHLQSTSNRSSL